MSRPSEAEISEALGVLAPDLRRGTTAIRLWAYETLQVALEPRPVWPAKEAAWCLGVTVSNLRKVSGIREMVAWEYPRPKVDRPEQTLRLYWADLVEAHPKSIETAARRAEKEGG